MTARRPARDPNPQNWLYRGQRRPPFAEVPGPGQESVWDYPRPPAVVADSRRVRVLDGDVVLADTGRALRVIETASPPTFYLPRADVDTARLRVVDGHSCCEWKGPARYHALDSNADVGPIAWDYPRPRAAFAILEDHIAFYPARVACHVAGERVRPQPGGFYGGWLTAEIVGPVKGEPGTGHW